MKTIPIIQLGIGNVGREVIRQIQDLNKQHSDVSFQYIGIANSRKILFHKDGIPFPILKEIILSKEIPTPGNVCETESHDGNLTPFNTRFSQIDLNQTTIVDTTDTDSHIRFLIHGVEQGTSLVLANKKPLVRSMDEFSRLTSTSFGFRATVGAGLPVIPAISELLSKDETIQKIEGCFSGSLGILCSSLEKGEAFSTVVNELKEKGFTEPDPRDDLSGKDLARKILILTRLSGYAIEMDNIHVDSIYPEEMASLTIGEFLLEIETLDNVYKEKYISASERDCTLRFVATWEDGECKVGLKEVQRESQIGRLTGAKKLALIYTGRDQNDPVVVNGAGAGAKSAAKDVVDDLIEVNKKFSN